MGLIKAYKTDTTSKLRAKILFLPQREHSVHWKDKEVNVV